MSGEPISLSLSLLITEILDLKADRHVQPTGFDPYLTFKVDPPHIQSACFIQVCVLRHRDHMQKMHETWPHMDNWVKP